MPLVFLGDEAAANEVEEDVMASLARSTDVRGVVAVEYDILCVCVCVCVARGIRMTGNAELSTRSLACRS
jgi:hypothetical protein